MPGGDRTGPGGRGPITGRGMGLCAGYEGPGYLRPRFGRGFFRGRSRRLGPAQGWEYDRPGYDPYQTKPLSQEQERQGLQQEAEYLKEQIKDIEDRLRDFANQKKTK